MSGKKKGPRKGSSKPGWQKDVAGERIRILFGLAEANFPSHPERSDRYVELARKIGMRYNVTIPKELKRRFCRHCYRYLVPGKNSVVRSESRTQSMAVKCLGCGKTTRYPYSREKGVKG